MSHNPTVINQFSQFDTTMDKVLFITMLILTLGLLFSTVYFLFKFNFKFESFIYISLTGILYIVCTTPLLQNINTDGLNEQPLLTTLMITSSLSLLWVYEGITIFSFMAVVYKMLIFSINGEINIKNSILYLYSLFIVLLLIMSPLSILFLIDIT